MTKQETAEYMRLTVRRVEDLVAKGSLHPIQYPGIRRYYFDRRAVDLLIEQSQISAVPAMVPALVPAKVSKYGLLESSYGIKR